MGNKAAQPVRRYAHLDAISSQRQAFDIRRREQEIAAAEKSATAFPINPMGGQHQGYVQMQSQIAQDIAVKREALKAAMALDGDDRVLAYCQREIAEAEMPDVLEIVNPDGSPLARGGYLSPIPPGMF
jgi:hypothetical protein